METIENILALNVLLGMHYLPSFKQQKVAALFKIVDILLRIALR